MSGGACGDEGGDGDEAGQTVVRLRADVPLRVVIEAGRAPAASAEVEARWEEMRRAIPRLFDAPVLHVAQFDAAAGVIRCRRDSYKRLVVQPGAAGEGVPTGVEQLSVTGVLLARDADRETRVLLGRRGSGTRMYAGMWELGPAGGVEVPAWAGEREGEIGLDALVAELVREVREECGLNVSGRPARAAAVVHDAYAHSYDIVMVVDSGPLAGAGARARAQNWEYEQVRWVPRKGIATLLADGAMRVIPPSRALLEMLRHGEL